MSITEFFGMAAGTITSITFLPQVIRIWKTKSVKDLSMIMVILLVIGTACWLSYGFLKNDTAIIYTNVLVLIMSLVIFYFKLKYR